MCELPPSSITHLTHPPCCLFLPNELFLSPQMFQHLPFPNCSTHSLEHPSTTLPPFPLHLLPLQGSYSALPASKMFFMETAEKSGFGCWGWWVGLSRGSLDASTQGAKGTSCTPEPVGMKCVCIKIQSQDCPWAVELQEAGERNEAVHLHLLQATELRVAGCGLHFFFLSCF